MNPQIQNLGFTRKGLPILSYEFSHPLSHPSGKEKSSILILSGVHGDEVEGIKACYLLLHHYLELKLKRKRELKPEKALLPLPVPVTFIPELNLDGILLLQRQNAKGVDLNRNFPTADWEQGCSAHKKYYPGEKPASEPETQALLKCIEANAFQCILSLHSWPEDCLLNINGSCYELAENIAKQIHAPVSEDIGYSTPGSLGTYASVQCNIPILTYEFKIGTPEREIIKTRVPAIINSLKFVFSHKLCNVDF